MEKYLSTFEKVPYGEAIGAQYPYNAKGDMVWNDPDQYFIERSILAITELLARAKSAEARCETLESIVKKYQEEIVPGYRERAEKAEAERDRAIFELQSLRNSISTAISKYEQKQKEKYGKKEE